MRVRIYAIGDLHLPGGDKKPMDIFGKHWEHHFERICENWRSRVGEEDIVLIPGDISWAMQLSRAAEDLRRIAQLPGRTLILRGNHDYWWSSLTQLRDLLPANMHAVQNDAFDGGEFVLCGTRGWVIPPSVTAQGQTDASLEDASAQDAQARADALPVQDAASAQDEKLYRREAIRLEMSLDAAKKIACGRPIVAMMHYPPVTPDTLRSGTEFTRLLSRYGVSRCVYGHLHGRSIRRAFVGEYGGVRYDLVSCDALEFRLLDVTP